MESEVGYNLNEARDAKNPLDYKGTYPNHKYYPSPKSWRFPTYTLFLDRWVNGDPTNDNINGTFYEYDLMSNQLRHGGDLAGFIDSLDYLQGMGVQAVYIAGPPYVNQPSGADSYSVSELDSHPLTYC